MPVIKPFKAILPAASKVEEVVVRLENLSLTSAKEIRSEKESSFVHLLVPKIDNYYLRGSKQELAFKKISENLEDFKAKEILIQDEQPAIYIYRQIKNGHSHTGIWTVSAIDDYINNRIKKHELTRKEREKGLIAYLQQTGLDANPVLITYPSHAGLEGMIKDYVERMPVLDFEMDQAQHQVWRIDDAFLVREIVQIFNEMPHTYIADGHHRAAAASTYGIERRKLNLKHKGDEEYNFFSSVYISSNQLEILPFHRFVKLEESPDEQLIIDFLNKKFDVMEIEPRYLLPEGVHQFGFYRNKRAFLIDVKRSVVNDVLRDLDVNILQNDILQPLFQIHNPGDENIQFFGGDINLEHSLKKVDEGIFDLVFFLYPTSIDDLMKIADIGDTMPPKSTWFEPKFLVGLITHEID